MADTESTARPPAPYGLAYARIEVPDLDASVDWYGYHVGLVVNGRDDTHAYLRHGLSHHSIELISAPALTESWVPSVGYTVASRKALDSLHERVTAAGAATEALDERTKGLCREGFRLTDPNGLGVDLLWEFDQYAVPPDGSLLPREFVHPFFSTDRYEESLDFYTKVLGFLVSDHIVGSTAFLRGENRYHHSLALRRDSSFYAAHLCYMMGSFDDMMRRRARALYKKVPLPADMMNHSASGSIATYLHVPAHGPRIELCDGHVVFDPEEHERHEPRFMTADPRNIDVWRAAADDWSGF